jgi:CRISPR-associated protein Cas1
VFRHNIIQDWAEFNGRSMHPPQDTVNAVLSFLYTLLFFRIDSVLEIEGLDSYVGYFHELGYGKRALTYDLMEEYRTPVADTLCCSLFNRGTLTEEDFRTEVFSTNDAELPLETADSEENDETPAYEEKKGVLLTKKGLQKVIPHFEKKLETEIFYHPLGSHIPYKRVFREQVRHFKRVINGDEESYKPLVIK